MFASFSTSNLRRSRAVHPLISPPNHNNNNAAEEQQRAKQVCSVDRAAHVPCSRVTITVRSASATQTDITLPTWATIADLLQAWRRRMGVAARPVKVWQGQQVLPLHRSLTDAGCVHDDDDERHARHVVDIISVTTDARIETVQQSVVVNSQPLQRLLRDIRRGFAAGLKPQTALDGTGGTYFLTDERRRPVAVFKPLDEEPYAVNNPRGYTSADDTRMRRGICPGTSGYREVAAYQLDHGNFARVPPTHLVQARHATFHAAGRCLTTAQGGAHLHHDYQDDGLKVGSLQKFIHGAVSMDDLSHTLLSVDSVQRIAVLDMRIQNADRNAANLLVLRRSELVPIDHGYCLPTVNDISWMDWCWLDWPQLKEPVTDACRDYVLSLDPAADCALLRQQEFAPAAVANFYAANLLLQAGVRAGKTLYEIACQLCRHDNDAQVPSLLEELLVPLDSDDVLSSTWKELIVDAPAGLIASGSDSTTSHDDDLDHQCSVVDDKQPNTPRSHRSASLSSEDDSSGSGFWHVRPEDARSVDEASILSSHAAPALPAGTEDDLERIAARVQRAVELQWT